MSDDESMTAIASLAGCMLELEKRAAQEYQPIVDEILRTGSRDRRHIEHTLDGLVDFCGHEPIVQMYRRLCRHYWDIDQAAAVDYVNAYRGRWDRDETGGRS